MEALTLTLIVVLLGAAWLAKKYGLVSADWKPWRVDDTFAAITKGVKRFVIYLAGRKLV